MPSESVRPSAEVVPHVGARERDGDGRAIGRPDDVLGRVRERAAAVSLGRPGLAVGRRAGGGGRLDRALDQGRGLPGHVLGRQTVVVAGGGDVSAQPRPDALRTFEDFENSSIFPGLSMTPVYDSVNNTVTMNSRTRDRPASATDATALICAPP